MKAVKYTGPEVDGRRHTVIISPAMFKDSAYIAPMMLAEAYGHDKHDTDWLIGRLTVEAVDE